MARTKRLTSPLVCHTVRIDPDVHQKLKIKLAQERVSFQDLVTGYLKQYLASQQFIKINKKNLS